MSAPDEPRFDENCEMAEAPERCATCGCVGHIQTVCPLCERECSRNTPAAPERCVTCGALRSDEVHDTHYNGMAHPFTPAATERCGCGPHDEVGRCEESAALARLIAAAEAGQKALWAMLDDAKERLAAAEKALEEIKALTRYTGTLERIESIAAAALAEIRRKT